MILVLQWVPNPFSIPRMFLQADEGSANAVNYKIILGESECGSTQLYHQAHNI